MNKEKMEKIKNTVIVVIAVAVVLLLAFLVAFKKNDDLSLRQIEFSDLEEKLNSDNFVILSFVNANEKDGKKQLNIFKSVLDDYYLDIDYIDYSESVNSYKSFITDNEVESTSGTTLVLMHDGEILKTLDGVIEEDKFIEELDDYVEIVNKSMTEINVTEYLDLLKNDDSLKVIYLARPTCSYCTMQKPILKSVMEEYRFNVYYLNSDNMSESDYMYFIGTDDSLLEGFGTPMIILTIDGKFVDVLNGYTERDALVDFLKTNEVI